MSHTHPPPTTHHTHTTQLCITLSHTHTHTHTHTHYHMAYYHTHTYNTRSAVAKAFALSLSLCVCCGWVLGGANWAAPQSAPREPPPQRPLSDHTHTRPITTHTIPLNSHTIYTIHYILHRNITFTKFKLTCCTCTHTHTCTHTTTHMYAHSARTQFGWTYRERWWWFGPVWANLPASEALSLWPCGHWSCCLS